MTAAFHLNIREDKRELKVYNNDRLLPFCLTPTYLGVQLDRSLTFRHHLVALRKKLSSPVKLLRRLADSEWGTGDKTLCKAALSLFHSTAEYCAPIWCCSAHTCLVDSVLNDVLRIIIGCLLPTPTDHLLSGIQPAELRQLEVTLSLAYRESLEPDHIFYNLLSGYSNARQERLRFRRPFVPAAQNLLKNLARLGIRASEWIKYRWNAEYCENTYRLCVFIPRTSTRLVRVSLPQTAWVKLNHLRTGVGQFHLYMWKWGLATAPNGKCGAAEQTADHILIVWSIHRVPFEYHSNSEYHTYIEYYTYIEYHSNSGNHMEHEV